MCRPLREQAHSHPGFRLTHNPSSTTNPTLDFGQPQILHPAAIPCGSGLARESVRSADTDAECTGLFVSKPTPTLFLVHRHILPTNMFGALFILPVILMYTFWSYYVFRGKVRIGDGYH